MDPLLLGTVAIRPTLGRQGGADVDPALGLSLGGRFGIAALGSEGQGHEEDVTQGGQGENLRVRGKRRRSRRPCRW